MAIKLDAKADATIAQAAARASLSAVPKDMSKSFEGIAKGYANTMEVFGAYGAQLAQTIGQIAAPLVEEGISRVTSTIDGTYDAKGVQSTISSPIITEIQKTRANKPKRSDEKYQVDGEFDKTTFKSDKATWRQGINDLYNTAKAVKDGIFKNITQVAAGDMNAEGTGAENMFMHAAISKEGAKIENGIEGHIGANAELVIGEDGDFSFNFKDSNGKLVYGVAENGALITTPTQEGQKPLTLKKSDMNTLITPKNLAIDNASGKVKLDIAKMAKQKGANSITQSEYDQVVSNFSKSTATDNDFKHATNTVLFGKETYAEALLKPNSITQEMFTAVGGEKVVGLKDVDGKEGIGLGDLTDASNMAIMRRELLNPKNPNARKAFNEYYEQGLKSVAADAGRQYTPPSDGDGDEGSKGYYIDGSYLTGPAKIKVDQNVAVLNKDEDFPAQAGWNGLRFRRVKGEYQMVNNEGKFVPTTLDSIITSLGLSETEGIKPLKSNKKDIIPDMPTAPSGVTLQDIREANPDLFK